jgi:DNA primase catalytic core
MMGLDRVRQEAWMARIPDEVVERLKHEVSVQRLAEAKGIELKRHGENLVGRCPFHEDRTPSLVITPSKNLWHCMGACQAGGTVIDFVMRVERCSFRLACEMLLKDAPSLAASLDADRPRTTTAKLEEIAKPEEPDAVVLRRVVDFYHATLKESGEAAAYLGSRGIENAELVETFKLGFANRTLGYRLPPKAVKAGAAVRSQLQRLGVMRESGHEHFTGSIVVPIFDEQGAVVEMYGRKITPGLRPGTPLHMYLPGPHRGVFNLQALKVSKDIILCEALIDAMTFWCAGFRNVTTSYGVEGFTPELRAALGAYDVERVLIAYDADEAGNRAAEKLAPELAAMGLSVFRVNFPKGMDANEYALKVKPAERSLGTALRAVHWMAGGRPVSVPSEVVNAHSYNHVAAETNGSRSALRARDVVEEPAPEFVVHEVHEHVVINDEQVMGPLSPEVVTLEEQEEPAATIPFLAAERGDEPAREDAASAAVAPSLPRAPTADLHVEVTDEQVVMQLGDRKWRIRGLAKNLSPTQLKVNVFVARGAAFFVDQLELNSARHRAAFLAQASRELETEERILKRDLGLVFQKLEELQDQAIQKALEPKAKPAPEMTEGERKEALTLLRDAKLLDRILEDFDRAGVVGEETNKLVGYLAAISRKLSAPLGVVIQSTSAAGKSSLMDAVLSFVPEEERVQYSAMTGQSLYYMGEADLQHKILAIAEEEGASNASYALKLLQSEGELTIASTGKNPADGRLVTQEYRVTGPVMVMMTTTAIELDEELMNRCVVLTVDDGREQTRAIHEKQREAQTIEGILARQDRGAVMKLHQNAQRLLKPVTVANPFARELRFADHATRTRRDHAKYLTLINTIALLHQHQRPLKEVEHRGSKVRYIEVTREDIATADRLAAQVLARGLDELAPQTRKLLGVIDELVTERAQREGTDRSDVRFTQRELRDYANWSATQVKVQLKRLEELEYVAVHHRAGHRQRALYELCVSAPEGAPSPLGAKGHEYDANRSGFVANRSGEKVNRSATGPNENRPVFSSEIGGMSKPVRSLGGHVTGVQEKQVSYRGAATYAQAPDAAE